MSKIPTLYSDYQECILDLDIYGKIVSTPQQSIEELTDALFEEFKRRKPMPTLEYKRYELSRLVSPDYHIVYNKELELQDNESLVELRNSQSSYESINFEDLSPLIPEVQEAFSYEMNITDSVRQSIIEKYDLETGEEFKPGIRQTENIVGTVEEDTSLRLSDESTEKLGVDDEGEVALDINENYEPDDEEEEFDYDSYSDEDEEEIDDSDEEDVDDYSSYSDEEEIVDSDEEEEEEEEESDYDSYLNDDSEEEEIADSEEEIDDYSSYSDDDEEEEIDDYSSYSDDEEEEVDDSEDDEEEEFDYDSYSDDEEDVDDYSSYSDESESEDEDEIDDYSSYSSDDEEEEEEEVVDYDSYSSKEEDDEEVNDYSSYSLDDEEEEEVDDHSFNSSDDTNDDSLGTTDIKCDQSQGIEQLGVDDSDLDEPDFSPYEEPVAQVQIKIPVTPAQIHNDVSQPEVVDRSAEPTDIRAFLRKHPRCEYNFALNYFTKKQINDAIKIGKIIKKGSILKII